MKVFCLNKISQKGLVKLSSNDEIVSTIDEAEVILVRSADMHELNIPDNIIAVARAGAGVNNIPIPSLTERGIIVFNTPGANANAVKEIVLCGIFLGSREIVEGIKWVEENKDNFELKTLVEKNKSQFAGHEIIGKKIGVIGLGGIGVLVANACYDLGMEVLGYDPFLSINNAMNLNKNINYVTDAKKIYEECDYITIHIPYTKETKDLLNKEAFEAMKNDVVILNFARDGIINEEELIKNLNNKKVKKYITDFPNVNIMKNKNVIAIPHLGASTDEAENNCAVMAIEQLQNYYSYGTIKNSVNFPATDAGLRHEGTRIAINHKNAIGMISEFTKIIAQECGNIINMVNKSLGEYAYTIIDVDCLNFQNVSHNLAKIDGVVKVRVI